MLYTVTLDDFCSYLFHEKRRSLHTVTSYKKDLEQFFTFLSESDKTVTACDYRDLRNWVISLDSSYNNKSIVRKIATLKSYFKFLFLREYRKDNPAARLKNPRVAKKLPSIVSEEEMNTLLDNKAWDLDFFPDLRDKLIIDLLYGTGIRREELIALKIKDISFHKGLVKVLGKGGKERLVPFNKGLLEEIKQYIQKKNEEFVNHSEHLIVTDKGKKSYPSLIYRVVKKNLSEVTTRKKRSPHVLRHSYATHLLDRGADLNAIKELLGHSSLAATQVYTHNSLEKLKEVFAQAHPKS